MSRKPKTQGLEWLCHSLASFNGAGYADKQTPEHYLGSYRAFKLMKNKPEAVALLDRYWHEVFDVAASLCLANDAGHVPNVKNYQKFLTFYDPDSVRVE